MNLNPCRTYRFAWHHLLVLYAFTTTLLILRLAVSVRKQQQTISFHLSNRNHPNPNRNSTKMSAIPSAPLPSNPGRLGNLDGFQFLIEASGTCSGDDHVFALLLVGSHPGHRIMRDVIRSTWGNPRIPDFPFKLIFPFGSLQDSQSQNQLAIESQIHGDIIQGNFVDCYHNVTLRDLMAMRWTRIHCPRARFVIHADDDIFLDPYKLVKVLKNEFPVPESVQDPFIACTYVHENTTVIREGSYGVERSLHPNDVYDDYCFGWFYVMTPEMAAILDEAALVVTPYWMNDAYITGTLVKAVNMSHRGLNMAYTHEASSVNLTNLWEETGVFVNPKFDVGTTNLDANLALILHHKFRERAFHRGYP